MKLDLIEPNAHYDMAHGKPAVLEYDNDGSWLYRLNIEPEMGIPEGQEEETQIGWKCYEVRGYNKATKENVLGVAVNESAVDEYKEYLQFTEDLDAV